MSTRGLDELRAKAETGPRDGVMHVKRVRVLALLDDLAAAESRVADLEAGIRRLADEAKPGLSKMCTCPDCEDDESPIWHDGTPVAWTLDPARLRALVGDETPGTGEGA